MSKENALILQEQNIISLCLQYPNLINEVEEKYFISNAGKSFYKSIKNLVKNNISLNKRTIKTELNQYIDIDDSKIDKLYEIEVNKDDFKGLYNSLKIQWAKLDVQNYLLNEILSSVSKREDVDPKKLKEFQSKLDEDISLMEGNTERIYTLREMFDIYDKEIAQRETGESFYDTGCNYLNESLTTGFAPQMITTLFAQSGVGKSTYDLYLINKQINKSIPCIYFSPEMPLISTMDRLIGQRCRIPINELYPTEAEDYEIPSDYKKLILRERQKLEDNKRFRFVEEESLWLSDIERIIEKTKKQMGIDYLVVHIDLLTMIKDFNFGNKGRAELIESAMNHVHEIARRQNVHIVGVVQSKRPQGKVVVNSIEDIEKLRPGIEEIKNSSGMEERSRIVISAFRRKYFAQKYLPDDPETQLLENVMDIVVLKQNLGGLSNLKYLFVGESAYLCKYEGEEVI